MLDFTLDDLATENASTGSTPPRPQPHPIDPVSKRNKSKCDRCRSYNELILTIDFVVSFMGIDAMRWNEIYVGESCTRKGGGVRKQVFDTDVTSSQRGPTLSGQKRVEARKRVKAFAIQI
jgi:hypothetical protein